MSDVDRAGGERVDPGGERLDRDGERAGPTGEGRGRGDYLRGVDDWSMEETGVLAETAIFSLRTRHCVSPVEPERRGEFVYLESPDWVNVIALAGDGRVVMIEQFRHGTGEVTLEIPGGSVEEGEEPAEAGLRELLEESGWGPGTTEMIGAVTPNPAIMDNRCHTLLVRDAVRLQEPRPDGTEEIAVRMVALDEVPGLIREGVIHHALVVAAFHHLALLPGGPGPGRGGAQ